MEDHFWHVKVSAGITFSFGGVQIDPGIAQILRVSSGSPSCGIYCVGKTMGCLLYMNYPGGSGLTAGMVFGRRAGNVAAVFVKDPPGKIGS